MLWLLWFTLSARSDTLSAHGDTCGARCRDTCQQAVQEAQGFGSVPRQLIPETPPAVVAFTELTMSACFVSVMASRARFGHQLTLQSQMAGM